MFRSLMLAGLAFIGVFLAANQLGPISKDIDRYNKIRAMSGDPPLLRQALTILGGMIKKYIDSQRGDAGSTLQAMQYDIVRYLRISTM